MRPLSPSEESQIYSLKETVECSEIEIEFLEAGRPLDRLADIPTSIHFSEEFQNIPLGDSLLDCNIWFTELSCRWRAKGGARELGGEFRIRDIYESILRPPPRFTSAAISKRDLDITPELRVVDFPQYAATGEFAAIRLQEHVTPLEMWYYDVLLSAIPEYNSNLVRINLSYCDYLESLRLTKGVFGWQYLFADVSLRGMAFRATVDRLSEMLDLFPRIFPHLDYSSLHERLEARL